MASRTTVPGTFDPGEVIASADHNKTPGGWTGYVQVTASQTGISTITDLTGLSVTMTLQSSRYIRITGFARLSRTVNDGYTTFSIREGSTTLQFVAPLVITDAPHHVSVILTPTSGSHTYKLSLERTTGTGTTGISAASNNPAYLLVEDLGSTT